MANMCMWWVQEVVDTPPMKKTQMKHKQRWLQQEGAQNCDKVRLNWLLRFNTSFTNVHVHYFLSDSQNVLGPNPSLPQLQVRPSLVDIFK